MRLKFLALGLAAAGAVLLSACGGGSDNNNSGSANVRLLNLSVGYSALDLKETDANALNSNVGFGTVGSYTGLNTSTKGMQLLASGNSTVLNAPSTAGLTKDYKYTVVGWGISGALSSLVLDEQEAAPEANKSKILVLNLASGSGTLDAYLTEASTALADVSPTAPSVGVGRGDSYRVLDTKSYRLRVTAAGNKQDIRLDVPAITLESQKVYGLLLTSAAGGNMVNATLLTYQGAAASYQNGTANVRIISALPRTATVTASLNGKAMLTGAGSPVTSGYENVMVTTGATLDWSINGAAQAQKTIALERSVTYGVLIWGDSSAPVVTALREDSMLPVTAGTAKVRVMHGATGLGPVSLVVNLAAKQTNVQPGSLSGVTELSSVEQLQIEVRAGATTIFTESRTLTSGSAYTLYLSGVPGAYEARLIQQL